MGTATHETGARRPTPHLTGPNCRIGLVLSAIVALASATPAWAGLQKDVVASIAAAPQPGALLPLDVTVIDQAGRLATLGQMIGGRPAVLVFADFTCKSLCGPVVSFVADSLEQTNLVPDQDYRLLVIGLDAKDGPVEARRMQSERLGGLPGVKHASRFVGTDKRSIETLTAAAGYRFAYDAEEDQFAHAASVFVVTADGRIARALPGVGTAASDLRLALVEAGQGKVGTWRDQVRLLCYGFDPVHGVYSLAIRRALMVLAGMTVLALALGIGSLALSARYRANSAPG
jgi:protein SCO1